MNKEMIFIPFSVPSLKNSKIKTSKGIFPSKTVVKYLRNLGIKKYSTSRKEVEEYVNKDNIFREEFELAKWEKPKERIILGYHFVRDSHRKWDFDNAIALVNDLLTAHDFIEDDNMDWLIPMPMKRYGKWYSYSKEDAGVYLKILEDETT